MVAFDESPQATAALRFAFENLVRSPMDTIAVAVVVNPQENVEQASMSRVKTTLRAMYQVTHIDVQLSVTLLEGPASQAGPLLCDLTRTASPPPDLLVVGSTGKSNVTGILVGSVSTYCLGNAACPVVVVKNPEEEETWMSGQRFDLVGVKTRRRSRSPLWAM
ncbi:hypothetical protein HDU96_004336 [Phlyctochytrium bullatum]|nr:hypothetical protein HDU96_004336 [Phlyctochytrium bullatum]